jgi:DNA-binding NtrC family response regulator
LTQGHQRVNSNSSNAPFGSGSRQRAGTDVGPGPEAGDASVSSSAAFPKATILFVDDEDLLRQAVSKMLRKNGLSVIEARDGPGALDVIRAQKDQIDVLLLDVTLPGASSRHVYEEAKRLRPGMPVIINSAKTKEMAAASLATSIERFLRKPFRLGDLLSTIWEVLPS